MKKITFLLVLALIASFSFLSIQKASAQNPLPYLCEFNSQAQFNTWTVISSAGNTNPWRYSSTYTCAQFGYSPSAVQPDDWMISPAISIPAAGQYVVKYQYGTYSTSYTEKMKVSWGTAPTVAAQTNLIADYPSLTMGGSGSTWLDAEHVITVNAPGNIYLSFYAYSPPNAYYIFIRNVQVYTPPCADPVTNLTLTYNENCNAVLDWEPPLWDNTNIAMGTGGLLSNYWSGNNNWIFTADDFDADGMWTIQKITSKGFVNSPSVLPTKFAVVIYQNNNGKPGAEIYRNNAIPVADGADPVIILPQPFTLPAAGKYWITIAGAYDASVSTNAGISAYRWNIYHGTKVIGFEQHLFDKMGLIDSPGNEWKTATALGVPDAKSMYFKIEGQRGETAPIPPHNIYRDGALIASNVYAYHYIDDDFDVTLPHVWEVAVACANGDESWHVSIAKDACDLGYILDCTTVPVPVVPGTTQNRMYPINMWYNNSYVQELFYPADIGASGLINSISFQYIYTTSYTKNLKIYLGNTSQSSFTSTTNWITGAANLTEVFSGSVVLPVASAANPVWVTITFQTPFYYSGGNLVVAVLNMSAYNTSSNCFLAHSTTNYTTLYTGADATTNYGNVITNPPTTGSEHNRVQARTNMKFDVCSKLYYLNPNDVYGPGSTATLNPDPVPHGDYATVTFGINDDCHFITDVIIDGISQGPITSYNFGGLPITDLLPIIKIVTGTFQYPITSSCGANGTLSPLGTVDVDCGSEPTYTFLPNVGYEVNQIFVDGVAITLPEGVNIFSYTFPPIYGPHTIYVTFKKATWYINVTSSGCGNVYPSGNIGVPHNNTQVFTFYPNEGCKVAMVYVDGMPYPDGIGTGSYTFYYVTKPHTLEVVFDKKTYPVTAKISAHGVINDQGTTYVEHGDDKTYTFYAMPGYEITYVKIDGYNNFNAVSTGTYTFETVTAPHTIDVIIAPKIYDILAETTVGGYITPQGNIQVAYQGNQAFTFEALPGYEIEKVLVDDIVNIEAVQNGAFAFLNVNDNHTIKVFFEVSKFKIMSAVYGDGGSIDPSGMTEITYFDNITYTITPEQDYKISHILVNGTNMGALETYTFSGVLTNGDIEAYFLYSPGGDDGEDDELGVTNQNLDNISIYSRTNVVYIVNDNNLPISDISIFDMYGRIVWQGVPQGNSIALNAATGIYSVRVTSGDNFTVTKVPIQR